MSVVPFFLRAAGMNVVVLAVCGVVLVDPDTVQITAKALGGLLGQHQIRWCSGRGWARCLRLRLQHALVRAVAPNPRRARLDLGALAVAVSNAGGPFFWVSVGVVWRRYIIADGVKVEGNVDLLTTTIRVAAIRQPQRCLWWSDSTGIVWAVGVPVSDTVAGTIKVVHCGEAGLLPNVPSINSSIAAPLKRRKNHQY